MDIRSKALLVLFKNNGLFINLHEYLEDRLNENKLTYKNFLYVYNKLYAGRTLYVKQNIYPTVEFLCKGYTTNEMERISSILPDAYKITVFSEEKDKGYIYNKLFSDLEWSFEKYHEYIKEQNMSKENAFSLTKNDFELTNRNQREVEILMKNHPYKLFNNTGYVCNGYDLVDYYIEILEDKKKLEEHHIEKYYENIYECKTENEDTNKYKRIMMTINKMNNFISKQNFLRVFDCTEKQYFEKIKQFYLIRLKKCKNINDDRIDKIIDEVFTNKDLQYEEFEDIIYQFREIFNKKFNVDIPKYDAKDRKSAVEIILSHQYKNYEKNEQEIEELDEIL